MIATISREDLKAKLDRGDRFTLIEALPRHNYLQGHLPGALSLPVDEIKQLAPRELPDKNADIVVYCESASCDAGEKAANLVAGMGYSNVKHYRGGKADWVEGGLQLQAGAREAAVAHT